MWCVYNRSKFFLNSALLINNEGVHGMVEKCESRTLAKGAHTAYIEGFQAGGGVGMEATYSGPDTGDQKVFLRSGSASVSVNPSQYFKQCDPTTQGKADAFAMCVFRSEVGLSQIPEIRNADTGINRLYFVGKGQMPVVDLRDFNQFKYVVQNIPDVNYAWAIYGSLEIKLAGSYDLCISSDDG
jgi:hypothetical protein